MPVLFYLFYVLFQRKDGISISDLTKRRVNSMEIEICLWKSSPSLPFAIEMYEQHRQQQQQIETKKEHTQFKVVLEFAVCVCLCRRLVVLCLFGCCNIRFHIGRALFLLLWFCEFFTHVHDYGLIAYKRFHIHIVGWGIQSGVFC